MTRSAPCPRAYPRARRRSPRARPTHAPPAPRAQERQPCTCVPSHRHYAPCTACVAWDHGEVLLEGGGSMAKTRWLLLHEPTGEVAP